MSTYSVTVNCTRKKNRNYFALTVARVLCACVSRRLIHVESPNVCVIIPLSIALTTSLSSSNSSTNCFDYTTHVVHLHFLNIRCISMFSRKRSHPRACSNNTSACLVFVWKIAIKDWRILGLLSMWRSNQNPRWIIAHTYYGLTHRTRRYSETLRHTSRHAISGHTWKW